MVLAGNACGRLIGKSYLSETLLAHLHALDSHTDCIRFLAARQIRDQQFQRSFTVSVGAWQTLVNLDN
ncbi:MAG: hypothetical protein CBE00_14020 [Planctomycetaceae bacterium TMED240]|nr:hypothetical protein [Rhodopirellula sp.]OUX03665.1 MAG: hypothetical protein CBE00_14020 [Planctomycetaceae bacterium TMED240]